MKPFGKIIKTIKDVLIEPDHLVLWKDAMHEWKLISPNNTTCSNLKEFMKTNFNNFSEKWIENFARFLKTQTLLTKQTNRNKGGVSKIKFTDLAHFAISAYHQDNISSLGYRDGLLSLIKNDTSDLNDLKNFIKYLKEYGELDSNVIAEIVENYTKEDRVWNTDALVIAMAYSFSMGSDSFDDFSTVLLSRLDDMLLGISMGDENLNRIPSRVTYATGTILSLIDVLGNKFAHKGFPIESIDRLKRGLTYTSVRALDNYTSLFCFPEGLNTQDGIIKEIIKSGTGFAKGGIYPVGDLTITGTENSKEEPYGFMPEDGFCKAKIFLFVNLLSNLLDEIRKTGNTDLKDPIILNAIKSLNFLYSGIKSQNIKNLAEYYSKQSITRMTLSGGSITKVKILKSIGIDPFNEKN